MVTYGAVQGERYKVKVGKLFFFLPDYRLFGLFCINNYSTAMLASKQPQTTQKQIDVMAFNKTVFAKQEYLHLYTRQGARLGPGL